MTKPLFAEKNFVFEAVTKPMFEKKAPVAGKLEGKKKTLKFLIHLGADCMLNNLSLDYMSGAELVSYLKACFSVYVLPALSKKQGIANGYIEPTNSKYELKLVTPNEFVKKISRFLVKNPAANAA